MFLQKFILQALSTALESLDPLNNTEKLRNLHLSAVLLCSTKKSIRTREETRDSVVSIVYMLPPR